MPEVDYAVLSEWFDWITTNIFIPVDLIGEDTKHGNTLKYTYMKKYLSETDWKYHEIIQIMQSPLIEVTGA